MSPLTDETVFPSQATENRRLAQAIDHTRLTFPPGDDETQSVRRLCDEARTLGFYAVCVRPRHVALCKEQLLGSAVKVATVIGFPPEKIALDDAWLQPTVGQFSAAEKVAETRQAVLDGADELDLVINVAQLKTDVESGSRQIVAELVAVREAATGLPVKVIIETDLLSAPEIEAATRWCAETGMAMVKTSTGMITGGKGATAEAVQRIAATLKTLGASTGIKASGGIQTRAQALAFLALGVNRLGTSAGLTILQGDDAASSGY